MSAMWSYFLRLLWRSLLDAPSLLSSNWAGLWFSILIFLLSQLRQLRKYGWGQLKMDWKENIGFGALVLIVAWAMVWGISVVRNIYRDHQELTERLKKAQEAERDARSEIETTRPFVVIEELSPSDIKMRVMADRRNKVLPDGAYSSSYVFTQAPNTEAMEYRVRNLSNTVPARTLTFYERVSIVNPDGSETNVPLESSLPEQIVLMPETTVLRLLKIPSGTLYTAPKKPAGSVRIKLLATFRGRQTDPHIYYYKVVLRVDRFATVEEMNSKRTGGTKTEMTDEGVMNNINELLK